MTIAIGFACKNGVLVASDSQMSLGPKYKQYNEPKISDLKFADGNHAILAISGALDAARYFQEVLEKLAETFMPTTERSIADAGELAIKQTRTKLLDYADHRHVTSDENQEHLAQNDFEVILSYYFGTTANPFIYRIKLSNGLAIRSRHPYEAIGCGSDIAGFILTGADFRDYEKEEAIGLAYYTVEACKKSDQACGGPVQYMFLPATPGARPSRDSKEISGFFGNAVREVDDGIQNLITQMIMSKVHEAYLELIKTDENTHHES